MPEVLTREQWEAWRRKEETQAFLAFLQMQVEEAKGAWARGQFNRDTPHETAVATQAAVENVQFCQRLIGMEYEDYTTAMERN